LYPGTPFDPNHIHGECVRRACEPSQLRTQDDELLSVFVHPDFQGRGIGSALMFACFDDAARRDATISIVKSVLGAEEFYGRHGFMIVSPGSTSKRGVIIPDIRMHGVVCEARCDDDETIKPRANSRSG
jgi:GNAT superfamily N-acetyltransferase